MGYDVQITEKAEDDLSKIVSYISNTLCNPKVADKLLQDFLDTKTKIADNPYMYPLSNDLRLQQKGYHRFLFKKNYIALYLIDDERLKVSIMRVFYTKSDYASLI